MNVAFVRDPADSRLADYRNVPDPELIERRGLFVAEGRLVVRRLLLESRFTTRSVLVTESGRNALTDAISQRPDVPVFVAPQSVMSDITGFHIHRGCLALGERPGVSPWTDLARDARLLVLLERVGNADNVGGVFRNAAAFGADAVLLDAVSVDPLYRKAIRTSVGAALMVPFARAEPWPEALQEMRDRGFATVALTPTSAAPTLQHVIDRISGRPVALLLGHEGDGLSERVLTSCEYQARISTTSAVDSLNVATAAGIALYELTRQS